MLPRTDHRRRRVNHSRGPRHHCSSTRRSSIPGSFSVESTPVGWIGSEESRTRRAARLDADGNHGIRRSERCGWWAAWAPAWLAQQQQPAHARLNARRDATRPSTAIQSRRGDFSLPMTRVTRTRWKRAGIIPEEPSRELSPAWTPTRENTH